MKTLAMPRKFKPDSALPFATVACWLPLWQRP